jgi:glutathione S-transferase
MHSGFADMRKAMPMNVAARTPLVDVPAPVLANTKRVEALWRECRASFGASGPFLFGSFSVADCYFAPVVTRFVTYATQVADDTRAYMDAVLTQPVVAAWIREAEAEARG